MIEFDVETTGLQPYGKNNEAFLWIFLGDDENDAEAIPFSPNRNPIPTWGIDAWDDDLWESTRERIQVWFNRGMEEGIRAWNAKFDRGFADQANCFDVPGDGCWYDGMLSAHAVDERRSVALKSVAVALFGDEAGNPQKDLKAWLNKENSRRASLLKEAVKAEAGRHRVKYYQIEFKCGHKVDRGLGVSDKEFDAPCPECGEIVCKEVKNRTRKATDEENAEIIAAAADITDPRGDYIRANYSNVPREIMEPYALEDVILTRKVCDTYDPVVNESDLKRVVDFETATMDALYAIEKRGLPVRDNGIEYRKLEQEVIANLERLGNRVTELAMEADPVIYGKELAGKSWGKGGPFIDVAENGQVISYEGGVALLEDFNPNSSPQILACLKARGADMSFMSKEDGKLPANADNLRAVDDELAAAILDFKAEYKVLSTYTRPMIDRSYVSSMNVYKEPFIAPDSKIHANYRQVGARTGRMSCSDPNMQNQPRDDLRLRYNIVAEPGHKLITCDLSNIEMYIFAAYCGEGRLLNTIKAGGDLHTLTADMIGLRDRKRPGGGYESARQQGKVFNFTIIYGGGLRSIKRYFRCTQDDARVYKQRYMDAYPEVKELQNLIDYRLEDYGYIQDKLISGRRYRVSTQDSYKAVNYLVQGTAASLLKYAVTKLHGDGVPMVALVHDEIVAHVKEDEAPEIAKLIEKRMTEYEPLLEIVPLRADADIVDRWSDAKALKDADGVEYLFDPEWAKVPRRYINTVKEAA